MTVGPGPWWGRSHGCALVPTGARGTHRQLRGSENSTLAAGAKANHLAYLGDATVGERVNYGAGSITANYDGANKHRTVIEADVHVGSNCVLVAPVTLGAGAPVGGGSTITGDPGGRIERGTGANRSAHRQLATPQEGTQGMSVRPRRR